MGTSEKDIIAFVKASVVVTTIDLQKHFKLGYSDLCVMLNNLSDKLFNCGRFYSLRIKSPVKYLDFLNSSDVRKYLQELHYRPTPLEKAFIIYSCRKKNICEKHKALCALAQTADDSLLLTSHKKYNETPLNSYLFDLIHTEKEFLKAYNSKHDGNFPYDTEECIFTLENGDRIKATLLESGEVSHLTHSVMSTPDRAFGVPLMYAMINIPTPFKKGDVVSVYDHLTGNGQSVCIYLGEDNECPLPFLKATGLSFWDNGTHIAEEPIYNYIDVEYCKNKKAEVEDLLHQVKSCLNRINNFVLPAINAHLNNNEDNIYVKNKN